MIGVNAGDDMVVTKGFLGNEYSLGRVRRVTPSGQVVLENGERYKPNGWRIGGSGSITPATDEARGRVRRQQLQRDLRERLMSKLGEINRMDLDRLERLDEVLASGLKEHAEE